MEKELDPNLNQAERLKNLDSTIYAVDLHWFTYSAGAVEVSRKLKQYHPDSVVLVGGLTATWYDVEILRKYGFIDAVVRGEAEEVIVQLVEKWLSHQRLHGTRGLTYRDSDGSIKRAAMPKPANMDELDFVELPLLKDWKAYTTVDIDGYSECIPSGYWLPIARGCRYNCIHCGGGSDVYYLLTGREKMGVRSPENVAKDIARLSEKGLEVVKLSHDPEAMGVKYYSRLLEEVKKTGVDISVYLESFRVPSSDFARKLARTFAFCKIAISAESPSENVRMSAGRHFTNSELFKAIEKLEQYEVDVDVYFLIGLPGETLESLSLLEPFVRRLMTGKRTLVVPPFAYTIDPHCPMALNPNRYGTRVFLRDFEDYARVSLSDDQMDWIGHETEYLHKDEICRFVTDAKRFVLSMPMPKLRQTSIL